MSSRAFALSRRNVCRARAPIPRSGSYSHEAEVLLSWKHRLLVLATVCALCAIHTANAAGSCAPETASDEAKISRLMLAGVPAILRAPKAVTKPPIVLWHGFGPPASESALMEAMPLDDVPAVKVYLGLPLFGERAPASEADSVGRRQSEDYALRLFDPAVIGAAKELPAVVKALGQMNCLRPGEKIALFGFSAGGAAVWVTLAERDIEVRAAVTVNAPAGLSDSIDALERATKRAYVWSPASRRLAQVSDVAARAEAIAATRPLPALLLFHGASDTVVTAKGAVKLEAALRPYYERAGVSSRLNLVLAPGVSHDWSAPRTLLELRTSVADWFNRAGH